ncbi:MAG: glycosyltransferase family 1 protein [Lachnospiraceae bacterium]|nr:glycosyltransferase family 1 protein [Lachnospiraceae bacterium]
MYKVLVFGMTENPGGVESFLMNYYRTLNKERLTFDFLCNSHQRCAFEEELLQCGSKVFHITARSQNPIRYHRELTQFFRNNSSSYNAIWVNINSLANIDYLKMAKKYGIPRRIIHSHNSRNMDSRLRGLLHEHNKSRIDRYATDFWACSEEAAHWFYQDDLLPKVKIIYNAIDPFKKRYDDTKRKQIRSRLKLKESDICVGNVGRLHFQKNQKFALDVFSEYLKINPDARLVFIGQGPDMDSLQKKTEEQGIAGKVVFAGVQQDIQAWLSALDVFLFPSVFEGLSIAALEAEANGVPILASDTAVSRPLRMTDNLSLMTLQQSVQLWAQNLDQIAREQSREPFDEILKRFQEHHFDIHTEAKRLERLFLEEK